MMQVNFHFLKTLSSRYPLHGTKKGNQRTVQQTTGFLVHFVQNDSTGLMKAMTINSARRMSVKTIGEALREKSKDMRTARQNLLEPYFDTQI